MIRFFGILAFFTWSSVIVAQSEEVIKASPAPGDTDGFAEKKTFSADEIQLTCKKYAGQYVSHYRKVFKIENCQRREVDFGEDIVKLRNSYSIKDVSNDVIAQIPMGPPLVIHKPAPPTRDCHKLEGEYITFTFNEIYYVHECKRRLFPDFETYAEHRKLRKSLRKPLIQLTREEFDGIEVGDLMPTIMDKAFKDVLSPESGVDVIPIDEACKGLNGRFVSYYSRIYRVDACTKREIDAEKFLRLRRGKIQIKELSAEQWISLPDGKILDIDNL